jgi:hypothetical protein
MSEQQAEPCSYALSDPTPAARVAGLRDGDLLIAVNGTPFEKAGPGPSDRIGALRRPALLSYLRDGHLRMVLTDVDKLGDLVTMPQPEEAGHLAPMQPEVYQNWQVMVSKPDGIYDIHISGPSLLALVLPPFWLIQNRLWVPLAIWVGISLAVVPTGWTGVILCQLALAFYFWRASPTLFRTDRRGQGMMLHDVLAVRSERHLHAQLAQFYPDLRYVFAPAVSEGDQPAEPV